MQGHWGTIMKLFPYREMYGICQVKTKFCKSRYINILCSLIGGGGVNLPEGGGAGTGKNNNKYLLATIFLLNTVLARHYLI